VRTKYRVLDGWSPFTINGEDEHHENWAEIGYDEPVSKNRSLPYAMP